MTTKEIESEFAKQTKEINKLKAYCTKLANALIDKDEIPETNWKKVEETTEKTE